MRAARDETNFLEPWPIPVRALNGLHPATLAFPRAQGGPVELTGYDNRLITAAQAFGILRAAL